MLNRETITYSFYSISKFQARAIVVSIIIVLLREYLFDFGKCVNQPQSDWRLLLYTYTVQLLDGFARPLNYIREYMYYAEFR